MDHEEATSICDFCHKEVAEANFTLHETHCRRFLSVCPDCDEAVPREHLKEHREKQHSQVKCSKCNQKIELSHLKDHELDECVERLQCCQYCELELPWKKLGEHSYVCGSRTEMCSDCGCYVTLMNQYEHSLTCSATDNGSVFPPTASSPPNKMSSTVRCSSCMDSFQAEDLEEHQLECVSASSLNTREAGPERRERAMNQDSLSYRFSREPSRGPWDDGGDPNQINICPHCHLALPLSTLLRHEVKCQLHILLKQ